MSTERLTSEIETLEQRLEFAEFEWNRATAGMQERDAEIAKLRSQLVTANEQRDAWKKVAQQAGVCMTCAMGWPDPYGCTDCLNTGWESGCPRGFIPKPKVTEKIMPVGSYLNDGKLCEDCPPPDYPTHKTRCGPCPRRNLPLTDEQQEKAP